VGITGAKKKCRKRSPVERVKEGLGKHRSQRRAISQFTKNAMHSQYHISHRSVNGNGFSPYEHRGAEVQRPYHQGHLGHHNPPIEEYKYYHEADVEDNVSPKYRQQTNGYHQASSGMSSYGSLTRESSVDSMDFQFPTYDPRTAIPSAAGQNPYANSQSKCRQLPCRTFISCGSCPYGDRCVFLHDPSIVSKPIYVRSKVRTHFIRYVSSVTF